MKLEGLKLMANKGVLLGKKHSPEILLAVGVAGVVTSTVMACKATLKAEEVVEEAKHKFETIKTAKETVDPETYSDEDYKKDLTIAYVQTAAQFVKLYGPAVVLGTASIACIVGSHSIMRKRNVALVAAYKAVDKSFKDYRQRVIDEFGEDKDRLFKNGIKQEKTTETVIDENGKKQKVEKVTETVDPNGISQYARFFDEACSQWSKTPEYNLTFLKCQQNYANDLLKSRGHVFLNEVYDMIGVPRTQAGAIVGWVLGQGDDYIDFGIFDGNDESKRDFVNGYERSILLDFNVDGIIYDLI